MSSQSVARSIGADVEFGSSDTSLPIVVVGAGLSGCMIALLLAQKYKEKNIKQQIVLIEHREDFRKEERLVSSREHAARHH